MRLNSSSLNAHPLNGNQRLAVYGAAEVISGFSAEMVGLRTVRANADAALVVAGEFQASAQRYMTADAVMPFSTSLAQTLWRSGRGAATLHIGGDLYYTRNVYGSGGAELSLLLQGHVGVVFIDGETALHPMGVLLDPTRKKHGAGTGITTLSGDFLASAIRMGTGFSDHPLAVAGILEPTHINSSGVRYIGAFGNAPLQLSSVDAGMRRQVFLGSADLGLLAEGSGRIHRPTLAGSAVMELLLSADFRTYRRGQSAAHLHTIAELAAEIHVRGEGSLQIPLVVNGTGYAYRRTGNGTAISAIRASLDALRNKLGNGQASLVLVTDCDGRRKPVGGGHLVIDLLTEGNPSALRQAYSDAVLPFSTLLNGEILTLFEGDATLEMVLMPTGYVTRHTLSGEGVTALHGVFDAARLRILAGDAPFVITTAGTGTRYRLGQAISDIVLFSASDGYLNPTAEDPHEQTFYRLATEREFIRPDMGREFTRTR